MIKSTYVFKPKAHIANMVRSVNMCMYFIHSKRDLKKNAGTNFNVFKTLRSLIELKYTYRHMHYLYTSRHHCYKCNSCSRRSI